MNNVAVEVGYGSATTRGRHPDHAWLVQLRRADRAVIVAWGLSRTAADHLADNITQLLGTGRDNASPPPE